MKHLLTFLLIFFCHFVYSQTFEWVKSFSCSEEVEIKKIIHLDDNSTIVSGNYEGVLNYNSQSVSSIGNKDFFICKIDSLGDLFWIKSFGGFDDVEIEDFSVSPSMDIFMCGTFEGNIFLDAISLNNNSNKNAFLARLNSFGDVLWAKNFDCSSDVEANSIELNHLNNTLFFVAVFENVVTFDSISLTAFGNSSLLFGCFNSQGSILWYNEVSCQDEIKSTSIKYDQFGNIYCLGTFEGNIFYQSNVISNNSNKDVFLLKSDSTGALVWYKTVGGSDDVEASNLFISDTCMYYTGIFSGNAIFQNNTVTSYGDEDGFMVCHSFDNNEYWLTTLNSSDDVSLNEIVVDSSNNIYLIGSIKSDTYFGNTIVQNSSGEDMFICKYDHLGNVHWVKATGATEDIEGISITLTNDEDLIISGNFEGTGFFDTITIASLGEKDAFIGKLNKNQSGSLYIDKLKSKISLFPNPTSNSITIFSNDLNCIPIVDVFDLHGKLLKTVNSSKISLLNYNRGIYLLKITCGNIMYKVKAVRN